MYVFSIYPYNNIRIQKKNRSDNTKELSKKRVVFTMKPIHCCIYYYICSIINDFDWRLNIFFTFLSHFKWNKIPEWIWDVGIGAVCLFKVM